MRAAAALLYLAGAAVIFRGGRYDLYPHSQSVGRGVVAGGSYWVCVGAWGRTGGARMMPLAWSFPCWRCADCRNIVEWCDAVCDEVEGRLVAVRHKDCA